MRSGSGYLSAPTTNEIPEEAFVIAAVYHQDVAEDDNEQERNGSVRGDLIGVHARHFMAPTKGIHMGDNHQ
jgi:hypothetical protein